MLKYELLEFGFLLLLSHPNLYLPINIYVGKANIIIIKNISLFFNPMNV
jgi:hypothetical protein